MFDKEKNVADLRWLMLMIAAGDMGPERLRRLMEVYTDVNRIFDAGRRACADIIGEVASRRLFDEAREEQARNIQRWLQTTPQADFVCWADPDFPREVLAYEGAPSFFLLRGRREILAGRRIALAGAMHPNDEGMRNAASFAEALIRAGRTVVTFLGNETDAQVARSALAMDDDSPSGLLVLSATGPDRLYPPVMRDLYHRAADGGLILTSLMPSVGVSEETLEQRRVLCSYLCPELLVVQAELPGPTHTLARIFGENNRDVYAIPGSIHSPLYKGSHKLLREGARLTESVADIEACAKA